MDSDQWSKDCKTFFLYYKRLPMGKLNPSKQSQEVCLVFKSLRVETNKQYCGVKHYCKQSISESFYNKTKTVCKFAKSFEERFDIYELAILLNLYLRNILVFTI